MQPLIRLRTTNDPTNMDAQSYLPVTRLIEVNVSGSAAVLPWQIPAGTFVEKVVGRVVKGLNTGTVDIGDEDAVDTFIKNSDWVETTDEVFKIWVAGKYYTAPQNLKLTFASSVLSGTIQLLITSYALNSMVPNRKA